VVAASGSYRQERINIAATEDAEAIARKSIHQRLSNDAPNRIIVAYE
jgi:hypothetical protein